MGGSGLNMRTPGPKAKGTSDMARVMVDHDSGAHVDLNYFMETFDFDLKSGDSINQSAPPHCSPCLPTLEDCYG